MNEFLVDIKFQIIVVEHIVLVKSNFSCVIHSRMHLLGVVSFYLKMDQYSFLNIASHDIKTQEKSFNS